jgi:hypothetical protein
MNLAVAVLPELRESSGREADERRELAAQAMHNEDDGRLASLLAGYDASTGSLPLERFLLGGCEDGNYAGNVSIGFEARA